MFSFSSLSWFLIVLLDTLTSSLSTAPFSTEKLTAFLSVVNEMDQGAKLRDTADGQGDVANTLDDKPDHDSYRIVLICEIGSLCIF